MKKLLLLLAAVGIGSQFTSAATIDRTDRMDAIDASSYKQTSESPASAFDTYPESKWLTPSGTIDGWISYDFLGDAAYAINSYAITSANDAPDRDPKNWVLEGSNDDGANWTVVDQREGESWNARYERRVFNFDNTDLYKMYRLNVSAVNDSTEGLQLSELEFLENGISRTTTSKISWSSQIHWGEGAVRAFDNKQVEGDHTKWLTAGGQTTGWLQYQFLGGRAYALNGYTITSANDASDRNPKDWTFQGSHDGENWDILDTRTDEAWENFYELRSFEFDNNVAYSYYKLDITANNGSDSLLGFAELELLERSLDNTAIVVSPIEEEVEVDQTTAQLEWEAGYDSSVAGQYVYIATSPAALAEAQDSVNPNPANTTMLSASITSFDPELVSDTTYYWQIESALNKTENSGVYGAGDPNNIMSRVWSFTTKISTVTFNPEFPEDAFAFTGDSASFTVKANDPLEEGTDKIIYKWYFNDSLIDNDNSGKYAGFDTDTLVVNDVQEADKGTYYCSALNENPNNQESTSSSAQLFIKKQVAHWALDAIAAVDDTYYYTDLTGEGNDATAYGKPIFVNGIVDGDKDFSNLVAGGAIEVITDPNSTASAGSLNPGSETDKFSISAWVNHQPDSENDITWNVIASKRDNWSDTNGSYWQFFLSPEGSLRLQSWGATTIGTPNGAIKNGVWQHVVVTYANGVATLYVDGEEATHGAYTLSNGKDATFCIGRHQDPGATSERFEGLLDDIQVFNYDLEPYEVVDLYNAETGEVFCIFGKPAGDINGDCIVDLNDMATLATTWMDHGYYPNRPE